MGNILIENGKAVGNIGKLPESVSVTADGVKTYTQILNALFAQIDLNKITETSMFSFKTESGVQNFYKLARKTGTDCTFSRTQLTTSLITIDAFNLSSASSSFIVASGSSSLTISDSSSQVPDNGRVYTVFY